MFLQLNCSLCQRKFHNENILQYGFLSKGSSDFGVLSLLGISLSDPFNRFSNILLSSFAWLGCYLIKDAQTKCCSLHLDRMNSLQLWALIFLQAPKLAVHMCHESKNVEYKTISFVQSVKLQCNVLLYNFGHNLSFI